MMNYCKHCERVAAAMDRANRREAKLYEENEQLKRLLEIAYNNCHDLREEIRMTKAVYKREQRQKKQQVPRFAV